MKVGDKVVCVKDNWAFKNMFPTMPGPCKGHIYEIEGLGEIVWGEQCLYILGFDWMIHPALRIAFSEKGFRPLNSIEAWNLDEQSSYLEWIEQLSPGVETVEK